MSAISWRRVLTLAAALAALLFLGLMVRDLVIHQWPIKRRLYTAMDASMVVMLAGAAVYLRWGLQVTDRLAGRVAGRVLQGFALLVSVSQVLVWIGIGRRGKVWWGVLLALPVVACGVLAIGAVHDALSRRAAAASPPPDVGEHPPA